MSSKWVVPVFIKIKCQDRGTCELVSDLVNGLFGDDIMDREDNFEVDEVSSVETGFWIKYTVEAEDKNDARFIAVNKAQESFNRDSIYDAEIEEIYATEYDMDIAEIEEKEKRNFKVILSKTFCKEISIPANKVEEVIDLVEDWYENNEEHLKMDYEKDLKEAKVEIETDEYTANIILEQRVTSKEGEN